MSAPDPREHPSAETLSALVDAQLSLPERRVAELHLAECQDCATAVEELGAVAALLRRLPDLESPRDFSLGPRVPGARSAYVSRLNRWYAMTRTLASTAAAVFVVLIGADLYLQGSGARFAPAARVAAPAVATPIATATAASSSAAAKPASAPRPTPFASAPAAAPQRSAEGAQPGGALQLPAAPQNDTLAGTEEPPSPARIEGEQRAAATPGRALPPLEGETPARGAEAPLTPLRTAAGSAALVGGLSALLALRFRGRLKRASGQEA